MHRCILLESIESVAAFVVIVALSGAIYALAAGLGFWLLVAVANLIYRISSGRWFPWRTRWTVVPFFLLVILCFVVAYAGWSNFPGPH